LQDNQEERLRWLEGRTAHLVREAFFAYKSLGMLWSIGKDSTVLLWIARKAFGGEVPFPVIHIDTSFKIPEMIAYRDKVVAEWGLDLRIGKNVEALKQGKTYPSGKLTRLECCRTLKTEPLLDLVKDSFDSIIVGLRGDEEGTRSKERYVSPRDANGAWDISKQPAELWGTYLQQTEGSVRIHPLLDWTELDIWRYIELEQVPVIDLYLSKGTGERYRSLGCACCTLKISSESESISEIVAELEGPLRKVAERSGRAQDSEDSGGLEKLRRDGYM